MMVRCLKKSILVAFLISVASSTNASEVLVDVLELVGKSRNDVATQIGPALSCDTNKYGERCVYKEAETEILFIDGKADWITVEGLDAAPFSDSTIELLGFESRSPSFENALTKRWDSIDGLLSVSLFKGVTNADYAYVKAYTE